MKTTVTDHARILAKAGGATFLLALGFALGRLSSSSPSRGDGAVPAGAGAGDRSVSLRVPVRAESVEIGDRGEPAAPRVVSLMERWSELRAQSPGAAREKAMAALLRELAVKDPDGALTLARQETNVRVRQALVGAALCGWASVDPAGSVGWAAENLNDIDRRMAMEGIIDAGMARRDETIAAVNALCQKDSAMADDYGRMLIASLAGASDFETAVRFATDDTSGHRDYWLSAALYSWSQYRPEEAVAAMKRITDPASHNEAMHGLILGWSSNDPAALVNYAQQLPAGPARQEALNQGLQNWVAHDPVAASVWLDEHESSPEFDSGAAKLATSPYLVANNLETALSWANSVSDRQQRTLALVDVIQQWAKRDPVAARRYAESLTDLLPNYRATLMQDLGVAAAAPK